MNNFRIAVKAFIVNDKQELLLLKRRDDDVNGAGDWEIPGGRLEPGEDPYKGLPREVREETGLMITVGDPLHVRHFMRDDGQQITMIIFVCHPQSRTVSISEEHSAYQWVAMPDAKTIITPYFHQTLANYRRLYL